MLCKTGCISNFHYFYSSSAVAPLSQLKMYSFMGGGLFCAIVGNILLVVSTATDYWMQYRLSGNYAHQGLWRYCMSNKCYMQTDSIGKSCLQFPLVNSLSVSIVSLSSGIRCDNSRRKFINKWVCVWSNMFRVPHVLTSACFPPAYWNATRAFMILSGMSCFAGIIAGIMSFSHFSSFERFNRSFAAGIMFFVSSELSFFVLNKHLTHFHWYD